MVYRDGSKNMDGRATRERTKEHCKEWGVRKRVLKEGKR